MKRDLSAIDRDIGQDWSRIIQEAFKHGIDCDIMQMGLLPGRSEQGIHEVSTIQNYQLESPRKTKDGRVFYYARAGAACSSGMGCKFYGAMKFAGNTVAAVKIGDNTVMIKNYDDNFPSVTFEKDELYGGYLLMHHGTNMQNRRIIANDATIVTAIAITVVTIGAAGAGSFGVATDVSLKFTKGTKIVVYGSTGNNGVYTVKADATYVAEGTTTTITVEEAVANATVDGDITGVVNLTLEEGLSGDFVTNSFIEILPNSYADLRGALLANEKVSHAGIPGTEAALGDYFWVQTWGPCWVIPGGGSPGGVGVGVNQRTVAFVGDGSINAVSDLTLQGSGYQVAGFIIQNDSGGAGPPLIMLQVRP